MVKLLMFVIIVVSLTIGMTMLMSFTVWGFEHPFSTDLGRAVWAGLVTWLGIRLLKMEI